MAAKRFEFFASETHRRNLFFNHGWTRVNADKKTVFTCVHWSMQNFSSIRGKGWGSVLSF